MRKSFGGHAKTSVTSLSLKLIKFHIAGKLRSKYEINVENFVMKCRHH